MCKRVFGLGLLVLLLLSCSGKQISLDRFQPVKAKIIDTNFSNRGDTYGKYEYSYHIEMKNESDSTITVFDCGEQYLEIISPQYGAIDKILLPPYPTVLNPHTVDTIVGRLQISRQVKNMFKNVKLKYSRSKEACIIVSNSPSNICLDSLIIE